MSWFLHEFTPAHPYWASLVKFLVLGTLGEWLGGVIRTRGDWAPFPLRLLPVNHQAQPGMPLSFHRDAARRSDVTFGGFSVWRDPTGARE